VAQDGAQPAQTQQLATNLANFNTFLAGVRADAEAKGIKPATLDAAFAKVTHIDRVIELDRKQPEFTLSFDDYLNRVVSPTKVEKGRRMLAENKELLDAVGKRYGVQPRFVVALWGIETDYGRLTGGFPVVAALATLAYDGRRSNYFRGELMNALTILDQGHVKAESMTGSWAGAMGQCQFMPSSFLKYAQDWDGDGRRDIWTDRADVLASAANYLHTEGWDPELNWGRPVQLPEGFDAQLIGLDTKKPMAEWSRLGVTAADGKPLPASNVSVSLVRPEPGKAATFLVTGNFRVIMHWNRSTFFALAAGHLADKIGAH
jgi:membrane-bound lytic murein transglycosylase B